MVEKWVAQLADWSVGNWAVDLVETTVAAMVGQRVA